jgi:hypothetical protein
MMYLSTNDNNVLMKKDDSTPVNDSGACGKNDDDVPVHNDRVPVNE